MIAKEIIIQVNILADPCGRLPIAVAHKSALFAESKIGSTHREGNSCDRATCVSRAKKEGERNVRDEESNVVVSKNSVEDSDVLQSERGIRPATRQSAGARCTE